MMATEARATTPLMMEITMALMSLEASSCQGFTGMVNMR